MAAGKGVILGGGAVAMGVGHGIGHVGGFAGRHIGLMKKKDKHGKEEMVEPANGDELGQQPTAYDVPAGQASQPTGTDGVGVPGGPAATTVPPGLGSTSSEPGTLTVTVLGAKDLKSREGGGAKPYVQLKMGGKSHKTGHVKGQEPEW